jgi:anti-sigma factor RsiW
MQHSNSRTPSACPNTDLSAYLDGELQTDEESALERHVAECEACRRDLNNEKRFLLALDSSLKGGGVVEFPEDFVQKIVVKAESDVGAVRESGERRTALVIFLVLASVLLVLFAAGFGTNRIVGRVFEQAVAVLNTAGHLFYNIGLSLAVLLRALGGHSEVASGSRYVAAIAAFGLLVFVVLRFAARQRSSTRL